MTRLLKVALLVVAFALLYVAVSVFWSAPARAATGTGTGPELQYSDRAVVVARRDDAGPNLRLVPLPRSS
jgi:hypothetical protein